MNTAKLVAPLVALSALGAIALIASPPVADGECETRDVVLEDDGGLAYETIEVCGDLDSGILPEVAGRVLSARGVRPRGPSPRGVARGLASGCACAPVVQPAPPGLRCERLVRSIGEPDRWVEAVAPDAMQPGEWRGPCPLLPTCTEAGELIPGSALLLECIPPEPEPEPEPDFEDNP